MNVETVDELVDQIADWLGIYGGCKNHDDDRPQDKYEFDTKRPFCCRNGFQSELETRIRAAVENERKLESINLK